MTTTFVDSKTRNGKGRFFPHIIFYRGFHEIAETNFKQLLWNYYQSFVNSFELESQKINEISLQKKEEDFKVLKIVLGNLFMSESIPFLVQKLAKYSNYLFVTNIQNSLKHLNLYKTDR